MNSMRTCGIVSFIDYGEKEKKCESDCTNKKKTQSLVLWLNQFLSRIFRTLRSLSSVHIVSPPPSSPEPVGAFLGLVLIQALLGLVLIHHLDPLGKIDVHLG